MTITGGSPIASLGTSAFLCIEDYGVEHARVFNQVLSVDGSTVTLRNAPARDGAMTLHAGHTSATGEHVRSAAAEAWADTIFDADLTRAIFDETFVTLDAHDELSTQPWVGANMPVEGWLPFGGLPTNRINWARERNTFSGTVFNSEERAALECDIQAVGQGAAVDIHVPGITGTLVFPVGVTSSDAAVSGHVSVTVDGIVLEQIAFTAPMREISVPLRQAHRISIAVTLDDFATAGPGDAFLRIGRLDLLNTAGKAVSRAVPPDARTVILGDSWLDASGTYGAPFDARLRHRIQIANGRGIILNRALSGMTSAYGRNVIGWVLENDRPDAVICSFGINDANQIGQGTSTQRDLTPAMHPDGETFVVDGNWVPTQVDFLNNIAAIRDACERAGVQFVFVVQPFAGGSGQTQGLIDLTRPMRAPSPIGGGDRYFATSHELEMAAGAINQRGAYPGRIIRNVTTGTLVAKTGWEP
ncbi:MAG: SGNH/GDSL hydrolase family protein, partial [Pseudomonadota bacterium]